jgi:hypothetical protein
MSLKGKITAAVNLAFNAVGDLAETVVLSTSSEVSYNFATGAKSETPATSSVIAIVTTSEEGPTDNAVEAPRKEVLIKEVDLPDPSLFNKVTISGKEHSVLFYKASPGLVVLTVTEG